MSDENFTALAKDLEDQLEKVAGVSRVETQGVRDREVTILVEQTALERFEISLGDVTGAIQAANRSFPIGQITTDGIAYNVAFEGDLSDTKQIADIAVTTKGQPIYLKDVAVIEDGLAPAATLSRLSVDGEPSENAITLSVYKSSGGDVTRVASAINARIAELKQTGQLLEGLTSTVLLDSGELVQDDLIRLSGSGLQTVVLVVLLLIVAIGWREGLLAGLAIPLSFLIGFIGLNLSGNTINFLSLFSLILGVGILVDSAIVMVEGINRKMKEDQTVDKVQAAIETVRDFSTFFRNSDNCIHVRGVIYCFGCYRSVYCQYSIYFNLLTICVTFVLSLSFRFLLAPFYDEEVPLHLNKSNFYAQRLERWYKDLAVISL